MGLADYLAVLRKRWVLIAVIALAGLALGTAVSLLAVPRFSASADVFVSVRSGNESVNELVAGRDFTAEQVLSYTALVKSPLVLEPVIEELGLDDTASSLAQRVTAERPENTVLITISATNESPDVAARTADAVAASLGKVVGNLERPEGSNVSPVQISTVRQATVPQSPVWPNPALNVVLGLALGLLLGVGVAVIREVLDTRVRTDEDVRALTAAPIIGRIGWDESAENSPLVVQASPYHSRSEAFRRLRTNLQFLDLEGGAQVFVVTSTVPAEGKSTTAINLAITLADADAKVLLVDADLRRPSVARYLGIEGSIGLTTALIHRAEIDDVTQPWGSAGLYVIPSGVVPPNPAEMVGSRAMAKFIEQVREQYEYIIIDTPPLLPVTDAALIAKMASGAVMIASSAKVRRDQLRQSLNSLEVVNAPVLGVVLNGIAHEGGRYSYRYGDSYGSYAYSPDDASESRGRLGALRERLSNWFKRVSGPVDADLPVGRHRGTARNRVALAGDGEPGTDTGQVPQMATIAAPAWPSVASATASADDSGARERFVWDSTSRSGAPTSEPPVDR